MRLLTLPDAPEEDEFFSDTWNSHQVYFLDAAGNIAEFIARHDLPEAETNVFAVSSILSISEIGLVSDNVAAQRRLIQGCLPLEIYRGEDSSTFTALGDSEGLFILVKQGRSWFPTQDRQAEILPTAVTVRDERRQMLRMEF